MAVDFSTGNHRLQDRVPFWVEVATQAFFRHGFAASPEEFAGRLHARPLHDIDIARCDCGPCHVQRTPADIARDDLDPFLMCIRLVGRSTFEQGERRVLVEPGTIILQDISRPLQIEFLDHTQSIYVTLPRRATLARLGDPQAAQRTLRTDTPIAALTANFLTMLADRIDVLMEPASGKLAEQALDLVGLAFGSAPGDPRAPSPARANALLRLRSAIETRLSDPALKPAEAAQAAGISVRYANDLLAEENSSVERYILHRRLERCRRALEDPLQAHRRIGEIAFSWGFSDHSHFTRRFRDEFGMTPGDCRRSALGVDLADG